MDSLKKPELWGGKPYSARYIGSLVGDFHRTVSVVPASERFV